MTRSAGFVVTVLLAAAAALVHAQTPRGQRRLMTERIGNIFFAKTTVPGNSTPLWFTVDTGANVSVIDTDTAASLRLPLVNNQAARGVGTGSGVMDLAETRGITLQFGALAPFSPPSLFVLPVRPMSSALGHQVDGVIGVDAMRSSVVEFDYLGSAVTFHDPRFFVYSGFAQLLALDLRDNVVIAPAEITLPDGERLDVRLLVDTGRVGRPGLNGPFVRRHRLVERFGKVGEMALARGINGFTAAYRVEMKALKLGTLKLGPLELDLSQATDGLSASDEYDGHIGAALLSDRLLSSTVGSEAWNSRDLKSRPH